MKKLQVAVIGAGYWGRNLIRDLKNIDNVQLNDICDVNLESLSAYKSEYHITNNPQNIFNYLNNDAVFIATRAHSHFDLAKEAILCKKHVWVEKPMATNSKDASELVKLAKENNVILHVDHTFLYSNIVQYFKRLLESGDAGDLYYIESIRTNYGPFMTDINVIEDLAPHDFSILNYLTGRLPHSISAVGSSNINKGIIDEAHITLNYDSFNAYVNVSWLSPEKSRKIVIAAKNGFISNDSAKDELITINQRILKDEQNTNKSPLRNEIEHFIECINLNKESEISSGTHGLEVMRMIEAANRSILENRKCILIGN